MILGCLVQYSSPIKHSASEYNSNHITNLIEFLTTLSEVQDCGFTTPSLTKIHTWARCEVLDQVYLNAPGRWALPAWLPRVLESEVISNSEATGAQGINPRYHLAWINLLDQFLRLWPCRRYPILPRFPESEVTVLEVGWWAWFQAYLLWYPNNVWSILSFTNSQPDWKPSGGEGCFSNIPNLTNYLWNVFCSGYLVYNLVWGWGLPNHILNISMKWTWWDGSGFCPRTLPFLLAISPHLKPQNDILLEPTPAYSGPKIYVCAYFTKIPSLDINQIGVKCFNS